MGKRARQDSSKKADYSQATAEERQGVVRILQRNYQELLKIGRVADAQAAESRLRRIQQTIEQGGVITGADFDFLLKILRKKQI